jgi:hypothetical protein
MAHFARLDENNIVTAVHVVHNNELAVDTEVVIEDGFIKEKLVLSEEKGVQFLQGLYGADTRWAQTSYNNKFRGRYAGIGYTFVDGEFVAPEGPVVETPVLDAVVEAQLAVETVSIPTLASANIQTLASTDVQALTTADIPALTTSDISSLG